MVDAYLRGEVSPQDYAAMSMPDDALQEACRGLPGLAERLRAVLLKAFMDLDSLPRTDPFWRNTNMKTTMFKTCDYFSRKLSADPGDCPTAWICLAFNLGWVGEPVDARLWRPLFDSGEATGEQLIRVASNAPAFFTDENVASLARLIGALRLKSSCETALQTMVHEGDNHVKEWAQRVLSRL